MNSRIALSTLNGVTNILSWLPCIIEIQEVNPQIKFDILLIEPGRGLQIALETFRNKKLFRFRKTFHLQITPSEWISLKSSLDLLILSTSILFYERIRHKKIMSTNRLLRTFLIIRNLETEVLYSKKFSIKWPIVLGDFISIDNKLSDRGKAFLNSLDSSYFYSLSHGATDGNWSESIEFKQQYFKGKTNKSFFIISSFSQERVVNKFLASTNIEVLRMGHPRFDNENYKFLELADLSNRIPFFSRSYLELADYSKRRFVNELRKILVLVTNTTKTAMHVKLHPNEPKFITYFAVWLTKLQFLLVGKYYFAPRISKLNSYSYIKSKFFITWFSGVVLEGLNHGVIPIEIRIPNSSSKIMREELTSETNLDFEIFYSRNLVVRVCSYNELITVLSSSKETFQKMQNQLHSSFKDEYIDSCGSSKKIAQHIINTLRNT